MLSADWVSRRAPLSLVYRLIAKSCAQLHQTGNASLLLQPRYNELP